MEAVPTPPTDASHAGPEEVAPSAAPSRSRLGRALRFFGLGAASTLVLGAVFIALTPSARGAAATSPTRAAPRGLSPSATPLDGSVRAKASAPLAPTDASDRAAGSHGKRPRGRSRATPSARASAAPPTASADPAPEGPTVPTPLARPAEGADGLPRDISPRTDEADETREAVEALERAQREHGL